MARRVEQRVSAALAWRRGSVAALALPGALILTGSLTLAAGLVALGLAISLLVAAQLRLRALLRQGVLNSQLNDLPVMTRYSKHLCSARRRHRLATAMRRTALDSHRAQGRDVVQWDRVRRVATELHALAEELDGASWVDPRTMLEIELLLCDGRLSPLLNPRISDAETDSTLLTIRFRLRTSAGSASPEPPNGRNIGRSTHGGLAAPRLLSGWLARYAPVKRRRVN